MKWKNNNGAYDDLRKAEFAKEKLIPIEWAIEIRDRSQVAVMEEEKNGIKKNVIIKEQQEIISALRNELKKEKSMRSSLENELIECGRIPF